MTMADDKKQKKAPAKDAGKPSAAKGGDKAGKAPKGDRRPKGGGEGAATATTSGRPQASVGKPRMAKHYEEQVRPS
jgi:hypothetical protein